MKLLKLHIDNFGTLRNYDYEFQDGLNVFREDNGWGKTTLAAFLKAMLYGFGTKRSHDITENERKRYLPWQGGKYGGSLDFESEGVQYRVTRTFGETPRGDKMKIIEIETGATATKYSDQLGEKLFGLDSSAFQRSVFIRQNGLGMEDAAGSLHARLNVLVSQANDAGAFDGAIQTLTEQIKQYEKRGNHGELPEITQQISKNEQLRRKLETELNEQDAARDRITELDLQISALNAALTKKKQLLDEVSGEAKKREAADEQIDQLSKKQAELTEQLAALLHELGGTLPSQKESAQAHADQKTILELTEQQSSLSTEAQQLQDKLAQLKALYHGAIPSPEQLNAIQNAYGEWQGVLGVSGESDSPESEPSEYTALSEAGRTDSQYIDRLRQIIVRHDELQQLLSQVEKADSQIETDRRSFDESRKSYSELNAETARLNEQRSHCLPFSPERIEPAIHELETAAQNSMTLQTDAESLKAEIQHTESDWKTLKSQYTHLREEAERLRIRAEEKAAYSPERTDPVIDGLEALADKKQILREKCADIETKLKTSAQRWNDTRGRYALLLEQHKQAQSTLADKQDYSPEKTEPAIKALETAQQTENLCSDKEQQLTREQPDAEHSALLNAFSGDLPETAECSRMLDLCRKVNSSTSDLKGLQARLDGETAKADSLRTSANQIDTGNNDIPPAEPKSDHSRILLLIGAVVAVTGILLAILLHPALAAVSAVGVVLIVLGITGKQKYQKAAAAFAAYQALAEKRREAAEKKEHLLKQAEESEKAAASMQGQISELQRGLDQECEAVNRFLQQWEQNTGIADPAETVSLLERMMSACTLRDRQAAFQKKKEELSEQRQQAAAERRIADEMYPAYSDKPISEVLTILRSGETDFQLCLQQAAAAEQAVAEFLQSKKLTADMIAHTDSPEQAALESELHEAQEQLTHIADERAEWDKCFPEIQSLSEGAASARLRKSQNEYQVRLGQQQTAEKAVISFLNGIHYTAEELQSESSPDIPKLQEQLAALQKQSESAEQKIQTICSQYPDLTAKTAGELISALQKKLEAYKIIEGQLQTAEQAKQKYLRTCRFNAEELEQDQAPNLDQRIAERDEAEQKADQITAEADAVLTELPIDKNLPVLQRIKRAEQMLTIYQSHADKLSEAQDRLNKRTENINALKKAYDEKAAALHDIYPDEAISERLAHIRSDISEAAGINEKLDENRSSRDRNANSLRITQAALNVYLDAHSGFAAESDDILSEIDRKAEEYRRLESASAALEKQKQEIISKLESDEGRSSTKQETALRDEVDEMEHRRDALLTEYAKKGEQIRQSDHALEQYEEVTITIRQQYEKKEHIQNELAALQRAKMLITQAKENLAERYLGKVEQCFNRYMQLWLDNESLSGILDTDFHISISENGKSHVAEGYSTGYCDLIDFCMRLALVDTLFEQEQPFLILDDPFVNLDDVRTEKALELLRLMSETRQMIYFVCHPIRVIETTEKSGTRAKYLQMAETAKQSIAVHTQPEHRSVRKNPRELYTVTGAVPAVLPANPDMRITNRIFSMDFIQNPQSSVSDKTYALFFIDEKGRLLGERRIIEIRDGMISQQRVQFCLNTREDSGTRFELMIHDSEKGDYEVETRIPFSAKLDIGISLDDF